MLKTIYNDSTQEIKWENVWNIYEFKNLSKTPQSTVWHQEGNVSMHTIMVVNEMAKLIPATKENAEYRKIMLLSALFHDIGKGATTFWNEEKKNWSSKNHAEVGEEMTRALLWYDDPMIRECVCYFVRNHMKPTYVCDSPFGIRDIITLSCDGIYPKYCTLENLIMLKRCDCNGSIFDDKSWIEKLNFAESLADEMGCLKKPYDFTTEVAKFKYFNESFELYPKDVDETTEFEVFVTFGKPCISTDLICDNGKEMNRILEGDDIPNMILEYCEKKNNFLIDISLIPETALESTIAMISASKGNVKFVYSSDSISKYLSPTMAMSIATV